MIGPQIMEIDQEGHCCLWWWERLTIKAFRKRVTGVEEGVGTQTLGRSPPPAATPGLWVHSSTHAPFGGGPPAPKAQRRGTGGVLGRGARA